MTYFTTYLWKEIRLLKLYMSLLAIFLSVSSGIGQHNGSWYRGCFVQNDDSFKRQKEFKANLVDCSKECMNTGFYFIAVQGDSCQCLVRVDYLERVAANTCDFKCAGVEEANLPCGGKMFNAWSVYAASGPFIKKVEPQEVVQWVEPNIPITLEAVAILNEFVDVTDEPLIESEWKNTVEFVWQSEFIVVRVNITANSSQERTVCTLTFPNTGNFPIDLKVTNLLSSVQTNFTVAVVVPKPRDIQLLPLIDQWSLPSCISPANLLGNTSEEKLNYGQFPFLWDLNKTEVDSGVKPVVAVFANTTFGLEVSVATGSDLLFDISVWNGSFWEVFHHAPHQGKAGCNTPLDCRSVAQRFMFRTTGVFLVSATVRNNYGSVEANLTVVVMDQRIRDVTAQLVSPNSSIVPTNQIVDFHLTAVTADRQSTFIQVDFGDGIVKTAAVREKQNVSITDSYTPTLFASYGNGCNLILQFDHVYETEGVFVPTVTLSNNISSVTFHLKQEITVLNEISGVQIRCADLVPVDETVEVFVEYTSMSVNATVLWTILDDSNNVFVNRTTTSLNTAFNFPRLGRYKIVCTVSNLINSKTAAAYIVVQVPVGEVNLLCNKGPYIEIEQEIVCTAKAQSGSDINFAWDFQEYSKSIDVSSVNLTSIAKHTFFYPGIYNISVDVYNDVNNEVGQLSYSLYVEIPIECLNVATTIPSSPGEPVSIVATSTRGTSLNFYLDVGHQVMIAPHDVKVSGDTTIFSVNWVFHGPARHHVAVSAYNHISSTTRSVDVYVQEPPPEFNIHLLPAPLSNFRTVALKNSKGLFLHRYDLLFHFHFSDGVTRTTQAPVVVWEDKDTTQRSHFDTLDDNQYQSEDAEEDFNQEWRDSHFHVNVTISNKVGQKSKVLSLANNESSVENENDDGTRRNKKRRKRRKKPALWHSTFVRTDEFTSFLLANKSREISSLHIDYGDGLKEAVSCLNDSCRWGRKFQVPGVFALDVSLNGRRPNRKDQTLRSVLVVEEPIKGLQLLGPTDVGIGCDQEWTADLDSGSHLVYVWSLDGAAGQPTTFNKYMTAFSVPRNHTLLLSVSNDINTAKASLAFTVKYPIVDVRVSVLSNIVGIATNITVLIKGGLEFTIGCNFGDGQYMTFFSWNLTGMKIVQDSSLPSANAGNAIPSYEVVLEHSYKNTGEYNVSVNVANGISSVHRSAWALVEEAIGNVVLYTETSKLLSVHDNLVVTAVVSSGKNLKFEWDFSDVSSPTFDSKDNTSTATYAFSIPQSYEISVTVSNHLQKGVRVTLPFLVDVVEPISKATFTHVVTNFRPNAAALLARSDGLFSTQEVQFEARAVGSSVQFTFDFGDGQSTVVDGTDNHFLQIMLASAKHVYTQEGVYIVKLTASNALSNLTVLLQEPFYVQIPPEGLVIKANETCIQFGKMAYFNATIKSGTNMSYTWKFDDETEFVDVENYVAHRYRRCGTEYIQVTASNKVDVITTYLRVEIVEKILGVIMNVSKSVIVVGKDVNHTAVVHPPSAQLDSLYNWRFRFKESNYNSPYKLGEKSIMHTYMQSGRHLVQVEAGNCLGSVNSTAVELHVFAELKGLKITILGGTIVSSPVNLKADYWEGDSLTFTWDFGDGSEKATITGSQISHNYSQIGEYIIRLHAKNPVSQIEVSKIIFVLNQLCHPPEFESLFYQQVAFLHSEPIRVEAEISINCTISNQVKFNWTVKHAISRQPINLLTSSVLNNHVHCPALLLPAQKLARGKYLVELTVEMNGTEIPVYSKSEVNLSVLATPLVSAIHGGISRLVGHQSLIHLDGRGSRDPDNSTVSLGYRWACFPLKFKGNSSCFESPDQVPAMNESQLSFPANWLSSNFSEFGFNLTVFRLNDDSATDNETENSADSSQVIELQRDIQTIDLLLECPQCWRNMINPDRKVSLRTHCPRCVGRPLIYEWKVEILGPEEESSVNSETYHNVCSFTTGFYYHQMKVGNASTATTVASKNSSSVDLTSAEVHVLKSQVRPEMITDSGQWERLESRANERREDNGRRGDVSEEKSRNPSSDSLPDPAENKNQGPRRSRFPMLGLSPEEGISSGTSVARNKDGGVIGEPKEAPGGKRTYLVASDPVQEMPGPSPCLERCLQHAYLPKPQTPHIISKDRLQIHLASDQTLTGLDQESLVIKPGVLKQGRTYFVQVRARAPDGSSGLAMSYFEVNRSPDRGKCSIQPPSGTSLKTIFSVFCSEWQDKHLPLRYEVSYSLNESDDDHQVIYHGLRHNIVFQLPAGSSTNNYQVLVHIAIIDRLGAKTLICRFLIEVRPTHGLAKDREGADTEKFLWNEAISLRRLASNSVYDGLNHDLFGPLTQVASNLNAHSSLGQLGEAQRASTRETIVDTFKYIPLRDEVEFIQALRCLVETTDQPNELSGVTVIKARELLNKTTDKLLAAAKVVSGLSRGLNSQVLYLTARAVSNLMTALASNPFLFSNKDDQRDRKYRDTTNDLLQILNSLIQLEMQYHSLGEKPLILQNRFISLNASHYSLYNLSHLAMNGVYFQLPASLESVLTASHKENVLTRQNVANNSAEIYGYQSNKRCFQTRAVTFLSNPFVYLTKQTNMVQSELASLDIYSCFGDNHLEIQGLPDEGMIDIIIPKKVNPVINSTLKNFYLDKVAMNVHHLNASIPHNYESAADQVERSDKYLHIHIQLEPVFEGRKFPIMVIISSKEVPNNLKEHVFKQVYNTDEIKIILPPGSIDGGMHYYICLMEASFNSRRRHSDEIKGRHYTLNTWWGACVYWNQTEYKWYSNGCKIMQIFSADAMHCQCNHLTTFGGYFELIPNDLSSIDVDAFFSLHENPVAIVLVAVSLLLYIVLAMILRQADIHDSKKGNCVYLQDNAVTHHQKYEVLMETGCSRYAGTTSKVSIILHGEEGVSETRELISDDNCPMFERESRDRFVVTLPDSLGKIFKVQLWHNNSGSSPGWFLQHVVVRDLNTGQAFYFLCQKWLAVDKDDGKVEREFAAIDGKNISFGLIFWCKGSQYLSDFHTWLSVWTCPPHSRFTRVQRLTVCFTLLMTYMCLSAMWFKQRQSEIRGEFGLLDLSWHNITVGCICCAIVLPMNLLLSFMFRRSRVHYPAYEQDKILLGGKSGYELASECEDESAQPTVTYSILDQSILNWQNIQDWAQKQWLKRQQSVRSSANSVKTTQASPQLSAPSTTPLVQTLWAEDDTDQASSGFEDATSQVTAERQRVKAASDVSSNWKKSKNVDHSDVLNTSRRMFLPFWCRYVAWTLCFVISCTCGTITILYGFRFGHTCSVMWIQSIYFSFMMCLFIAQPFLILVCVVYTAVCHRNNPAVFDHYSDGFYGEKVTLAGLHKQRSHYHEDDEELQRGVAERSRSRYLRFAGPPQEKQLKSSRKKLIKQKRAMLLLSDSAWFIVMFALLCIMAFGKDLQTPYHLNKALKHSFIEKRMNGTSYSQLKSSSDWYRWSQSVLLDTLFMQTSLRGEAYHMSESLGLVLGHVQLRQQRIRPEPCYTMPFLELDPNCLHDYNLERNDSSDILKSSLKLQNGDKTVNPGIWGKTAWYDSSGFVLQLNNSREAAAEQLKMLERENWIDIHTWAVFVELTLFNAASNLFSSVTLLLEVTPAGQVFTSSHIMSTYLFRYISVWDNCILGCELMYIVLTLSMLYHQLHQMVKMGHLYFHHFWNYIELLLATLSLLYTGSYIYRFVLVSEAVELMRSTFYDEFINLAFLTWWDELLKALTGAILFCVVIKLLCVLRYHQMFWRLQIVFRRCKRELLMAACLYGGFIMAFSSLNTGIFGSVVYSMRSLWSSILVTSALSVRVLYWRNDRNAISDQSPWIDIILLFSFTFCHGFVLTYIFTSLSYRLKRTKNCRVLAMSGHQLIALYWDKILKQAGWRPEASYEQIDSTLPPEFTMAEILYLVEEMLFRMNALLGMSGLPDKRHSFTDSDATANGGDDGISSGSSEGRPAPVTTAIPVESTRLEQCVQKIEDKLCSHEPYLAQLLKLDSIGTNILSEEKEQELRSHLEFEIFRQLQVQRQESAIFDAPNHTHVACPIFEPMMSLNLPLSNANGHTSPGLGYFSDEMICTKDGASARPHLHPSTPKCKGDSQPTSKISHESSSSSQESPKYLRAAQENQAVPLKPILLLPPKRSQSMKVPGKQAGRHHLAEALRAQKQWLDLSTTNEMAREAKLRSKLLNTGSSVPKYPKLTGKKDHQTVPTAYDKKVRSDLLFKQDVPVSKRSMLNKDIFQDNFVKLRESKVCKQDPGLGFNLSAVTQNASSGNISPQSSESEKGHKRTDSSSGQSGLERNDTARTKRPELPPKPTFSHVILPPLESGKSLAGWSPKTRPFAFLPEIMNPVGAESSSGSEQEAANKRVAQGRRNLRKTKSRGKGKGNEESITSPMVLAADFASSGQSGGSDFDIIIHPIPSGIDPDDDTMPEEYVN